MAEVFPTWPSKVMRSKWRVSKLHEGPTLIVLIVSEATGHIILEVECDGICEKNRAVAQEVAQHVVDLHNSQLGK